MKEVNNGHLMDHLGVLLDAMETCIDEKQVKSALRRFTRAIGLERFAYLCTVGQRVKTVTDLPAEWEERYHDERFLLVDPVVRHARRSPRPFAWSLPTFADRRRSTKAYCDEIAEIGVVSGVTIPMQAGFGKTAMLSFMSGEKTEPQLCVKALQSVVAAVAYVHLNLGREDRAASQSPHHPLTPRETVCVVWTSLGKRKADIAQMYGLSEKTVRFHVDNAKAKLNASNVAHMVRLACEAGIITR